jgi:hypothetical protein
MSFGEASHAVLTASNAVAAIQQTARLIGDLQSPRQAEQSATRQAVSRHSYRCRL